MRTCSTRPRRRVPFLVRLGSPFQSSFRPQEALTVQVLAGAVRAVQALAPDYVIQGGDLIDNDQDHEQGQALSLPPGRSLEVGDVVSRLRSAVGDGGLAGRPRSGSIM